jgi:hypothetical protein
MGNQEILTPSYEEACISLKHIIDVDFPTKKEINNLFIDKEITPYIEI